MVRLECTRIVLHPGVTRGRNDLPTLATCFNGVRRPLKGGPICITNTPRVDVQRSCLSWYFLAARLGFSQPPARHTWIREGVCAQWQLFLIESNAAWSLRHYRDLDLVRVSTSRLAHRQSKSGRPPSRRDSKGRASKLHLKSPKQPNHNRMNFPARLLHVRCSGGFQVSAQIVRSCPRPEALQNTGNYEFDVMT